MRGSPHPNRVATGTIDHLASTMTAALGHHILVGVALIRPARGNEKPSSSLNLRDRDALSVVGDNDFAVLPANSALPHCHVRSGRFTQLVTCFASTSRSLIHGNRAPTVMPFWRDGIVSPPFQGITV